MIKITGLILSFLMATSALGAGKIQNEDVKTLAQITGAGGAMSQLINDTKIYLTGNGLNEQLSTAITNGDLAGGGGSGVNYLTNPGFESGTSATGWTITTVTGANETSTIYSGKQSEKLTYSSQTGGISQSVTPTVNTASINMEGSCKVLTTMTTIEVCGLSGGVAQNCQSVPSTGTWQFVSAVFNGPSNGTTVGVKVDTTSSGSGTVYVDDCYAGPARAVSQISQANFVGSIKWAATASCAWAGATSATQANFAADTDCPTPSVTGQATAPGTKIPAFVFSSLPPGDYYIVGIGSLGKVTSSGTKVNFRFSDGTTNTSIQALQAGTVFAAGTTILGRFTYTTTQSNVTWQVQSGGDATAAAQIDTTTNDFEMALYYFPSQTQTAHRADATPASWSGYHDTNCSWARTSATPGDPTADASCTFTERYNRNFGTVTSALSAGNKLPGIVFTPARTGRFLVCVNLNSTATTNSHFYQLVDGSSNILIGPRQIAQYSSGAEVNSGSCGILDVTSLSSQTLKLQTSTGAGTVTLGVSNLSTTDWSIVELDAPMPAPVLVGSVMSNTTGIERIERAIIANSAACSSSPCTITSQTGSWLTSVTRSSTGRYQGNIAAGIFSGIPTCLVYTSQDQGGSDGVSTSTTFNFETRDTAGTFTDASRINVICMGPR